MRHNINTKKSPASDSPNGYLIIDKRDDSIRIVNEELYLQLKPYGFDQLTISLKELDI